jgi:ribosomal protein L9
MQLFTELVVCHSLSQSRDVIKPSTSTAPETPAQSQTVRLPLSYITSCLSAVPDVLTINSLTSGTSSTLFGSVHTSDVERLLEELDVPVHELEIRWSEGDVEKGRVQSGGRVKETGDYTVEILLKGDAEGKVLDSRRIQVRGVEEDAE